MPSIVIFLPDSMKNYVEEQLANSEHGTVSEYIRQLISQDQKRKALTRLENIPLPELPRSATTLAALEGKHIQQVVQEGIFLRESLSD